MKTSILYLSQADMIKAGVNDTARCVDVMDETFRMLGEGDYVMGGESHNDHGQSIHFPDQPAFPNMPANGPDRRFTAMLAYLGGRFNMCGCKWYGSNVENAARKMPRSILMLTLNDPVTCEPVAIMSANLLSGMRTGCVPGVGVRYLANQDAEVCAVVGAGAISRSCLRGICSEAASVKKIVIYDINRAASESYAQWAKEELGLEAEISDSLEYTVRHGDIINFAASAVKPVNVKYEWLKEGSLSICTGMPAFDDDASYKARLVFDNPVMHQEWANMSSADNYQVPSWYRLSKIGKIPPVSEMEGLGDIVCGKIPGRKDKSERIIFVPGGMPVEDVAWGCEMLKNAESLGIGQKLSLWGEE